VSEMAKRIKMLSECPKCGRIGLECTPIPQTTERDGRKVKEAHYHFRCEEHGSYPCRWGVTIELKEP